jgi:hypothetical protein
LAQASTSLLSFLPHLALLTRPGASFPVALQLQMPSTVPPPPPPRPTHPTRPLAVAWQLTVDGLLALAMLQPQLSVSSPPSFRPHRLASGLYPVLTASPSPSHPPRCICSPLQISTTSTTGRTIAPSVKLTVNLPALATSITALQASGAGKVKVRFLSLPWARSLSLPFASFLSVSLASVLYLASH